jgi:hypothetical protein
VRVIIFEVNKEKKGKETGDIFRVMRVQIPPTPLFNKLTARVAPSVFRECCECFLLALVLFSTVALIVSF